MQLALTENWGVQIGLNFPRAQSAPVTVLLRKCRVVVAEVAFPIFCTDIFGHSSSTRNIFCVFIDRTVEFGEK